MCIKVCNDVWFIFFFFFKQKTAYEMSIGDWSSDVCSSDLVEKQQHDRSAAAERDAGVAGAHGNNLRGSAHQAEQARSVVETRNANKGSDGEPNDDGLNAGNGRAGGIFFADAASDHSGGGKAEAEADGHDEAKERFGEADGGDGVRAETADPKNVDDCEKRFQHHFQNHGNGEQENGAMEIAGGEVLMRATNSFANGTPERGWRSGDSSLFQ